MLKTKKEIIKWLDEYRVKDYTINDDLSIDVAGTVTLSNRLLKEIPVQFNFVEFGFYCDNNELTSLVGCPKEVGDTFDCRKNKLTNLEGSPQKVGSDFSCKNNQLTSLFGGPKKLVGYFMTFECSFNELKTLEHCPEVLEGGAFWCDNNKLETLDWFPLMVDRDISLKNNKLLGDLQNISSYKEYEYWRLNNKLESELMLKTSQGNKLKI